MVIISPFEGGISSVRKTKPQESTENDIQLSQIFKNKNNIKIILNYLQGKDKSIKGIILRGSSGCGKTTLLNACMKEEGYNGIVYDSDSEIDNVLDTLFYTLESKGFHKLIRDTKKKLIFINDLENTIKPSDKLSLFRFVSKSNKTMPLLITSNDKSVGAAKEIPKCILQLDFEYPSVAELLRHFGTTNISKQALSKIITDSNFDLRFIRNTINELSFVGKKINITKVENYAKDLKLDTFKCIEYCLENHCLNNKINHTSMYTNSTVFQNHTIMYKDSSLESLRKCSEVSDLMELGSIIGDYVFENQCWGTIDEYSNIIGTIMPLRLINKEDTNTNKFVYPSSNMTVFQENKTNFRKLEEESMILKVTVPRYFNLNKFIGNDDDFCKEFGKINSPILAYRLGNITNDKKKVNAFIREFKRKLKLIEEE